MPTDNFSGGDAGSLGANWTEQVHGMKVLSSAARGVSDLTYQFVYWNADAFANDQFSEVTILQFDSGSGQDGPTVRASGTGGSAACYFMFCDLADALTRLYYYHGGSFTQVGADISTAWANNDIARLEVSSTTLTLYRNASSIGTRTDSNLASGSAGFEVRNTTDVVSLWNGGNIGGGGGGSSAGTLTLLGAGS